jgi:hypothetical protein
MWLNTLVLALRSIRRNLLRSFLTILGIVIGVSAVITMVTLGNGATQAVQTRSPAWAPTCCRCARASAWARAAAAAAAPPFKESDAEAIASQIGGVRRGARSAHRRHRGGQRPQLDQQRHRQHQRLAETGNWTLPRAANSPTTSCAPAPPSA